MLAGRRRAGLRRRRRPAPCGLAKAHATDVATRTAQASVEAHGGIGYTWDYPLHLLLKRAMHDRIVYGTPPVLRARVAALSPAWGGA